jgi:potassium-dependent mechanosensitive channel
LEFITTVASLQNKDLLLRELIETGYHKFLADSEVLFNQGERGRDFYLILSGSVETVVTQLEQTVKVYRAGEIFSEVAIMLNLMQALLAL